jgi:hypothetical protein
MDEEAVARNEREVNTWNDPAGGANGYFSCSQPCRPCYDEMQLGLWFARIRVGRKFLSSPHCWEAMHAAESFKGKDT